MTYFFSRMSRFLLLDTVGGFFYFFLPSQLANISFGTLLQPHVIILWAPRACTMYVIYVFECTDRIRIPYAIYHPHGRGSTPLSSVGFVTRVVFTPYTAEIRANVGRRVSCAKTIYLSWHIRQAKCTVVRGIAFCIVSVTRVVLAGSRRTPHKRGSSALRRLVYEDIV